MVLVVSIIIPVQTLSILAETHAIAACGKHSRAACPHEHTRAQKTGTQSSSRLVCVRMRLLGRTHVHSRSLSRACDTSAARRRATSQLRKRARLHLYVACSSPGTLSLCLRSAL
eukprot:2902316-Pleurochrysis_carterae.AAC.3